MNQTEYFDCSKENRNHKWLERAQQWQQLSKICKLQWKKWSKMKNQSLNQTYLHHNWHFSFEFNQGFRSSTIPASDFCRQNDIDPQPQFTLVSNNSVSGLNQIFISLWAKQFSCSISNSRKITYFVKNFSWMQSMSTLTKLIIRAATLPFGTKKTLFEH